GTGSRLPRPQRPPPRRRPTRSRRHDRASVITASTFGEPRVALGVSAGVVGIQVDEAALDLPVTDLEHVAPPAGAGLGHPGAPRAVAVLAVAGALADDHVAGDHPVEVGVVVGDRLECAADVAEEPADLVAAVGASP